MKNHTLNIFFAIVLVAVIFSCKDIKKKLLPSFNINIPDISLTVPPIRFLPDKEVPVGALKTHINMDSAIKANTAGTFGVDAITSVRVERITIKLMNPTRTNNLANFEHARMRIYSNKDTAAADIVNFTFPDTYSDSLTVTQVNGPEISHFLRDSELGYNLFWKNRRPTSKFLKLKVRVTLSVQ